jgi:hypothetical protein
MALISISIPLALSRLRRYLFPAQSDFRNYELQDFKPRRVVDRVADARH